MVLWYVGEKRPVSRRRQQQEWIDSVMSRPDRQPGVHYTGDPTPGELEDAALKLMPTDVRNELVALIAVLIYVMLNVVWTSLALLHYVQLGDADGLRLEADRLAAQYARPHADDNNGCGCDWAPWSACDAAACDAPGNRTRQRRDGNASCHERQTLACFGAPCGVFAAGQVRRWVQPCDRVTAAHTVDTARVTVWQYAAFGSVTRRAIMLDSAEQLLTREAPPVELGRCPRCGVRDGQLSVRLMCNASGCEAGDKAPCHRGYSTTLVAGYPAALRECESAQLGRVDVGCPSCTLLPIRSYEDDCDKSGCFEYATCKMRQAYSDADLLAKYDFQGTNVECNVDVHERRVKIECCSPDYSAADANAYDGGHCYFKQWWFPRADYYKALQICRGKELATIQTTSDFNYFKSHDWDVILGLAPFYCERKLIPHKNSELPVYKYLPTDITSWLADGSTLQVSGPIQDVYGHFMSTECPYDLFSYYAVANFYRQTMQVVGISTKGELFCSELAKRRVVDAPLA